MGPKHIQALDRSLKSVRKVIRSHGLYRLNVEELFSGSFEVIECRIQFDYCRFLKEAERLLSAEDSLRSAEFHELTLPFFKAINPNYFSQEVLGENFFDHKGELKLRTLSLGQVDEEAQKNPFLKEYLTFSDDVLQDQKLHVILAVMTFGKVDLIPMRLIKSIDRFTARSEKPVFTWGSYFLELHRLQKDIQNWVSSGVLSSICGQEEYKWIECLAYSQESFTKRKLLLDTCLASLNSTSQAV